MDEKRSILSAVPNERSIKIIMGRSMDYIRISELKCVCRARNKYFLNEPYHPLVDPVDDTICDAVKNLKKQLQPSLMMQEIFERSAASGEWQW